MWQIANVAPDPTCDPRHPLWSLPQGCGSAWTTCMANETVLSKMSAILTPSGNSHASGSKELGSHWRLTPSRRTAGGGSQGRSTQTTVTENEWSSVTSRQPGSGSLPGWAADQVWLIVCNPKWPSWALPGPLTLINGDNKTASHLLLRVFCLHVVRASDTLTSETHLFKSRLYWRFSFFL